MYVIRKKLSASEGAPPGTRVNPTTGVVETTPDGGATWTPNPGADPRLNDAYLLPATTEGDCAAAAGMVAGMQEFAARTFLVGVINGIATAVLGVMLVGIPGIGWMFFTAIILAGTIATTGAVVLAEAFTTEVWDSILCILLDNMDADGQVSEAQLAEIQSQIETDLGSTVAAGTAIMFSAWGHVGLSNVGVLRADPEANCDDCLGIHCYTINCLTTDPQSLGVTILLGEWVLGEGLKGVYAGAPSYRDLNFIWAFPETIDAVEVGLGYIKANGAGANNANNMHLLKPIINYVTTAVASDSSNEYTVDPDEPFAKNIAYVGEVDGVGYDLNTGTIDNQEVYVTYLTARYTSEIPSGWSDNCED